MCMHVSLQKWVSFLFPHVLLSFLVPSVGIFVIFQHGISLWSRSRLLFGLGANSKHQLLLGSLKLFIHTTVKYGNPKPKPTKTIPASPGCRYISDVTVCPTVRQCGGFVIRLFLDRSSSVLILLCFVTCDLRVTSNYGTCQCQFEKFPRIFWFRSSSLLVHWQLSLVSQQRTKVISILPKVDCSLSQHSIKIAKWLRRSPIMIGTNIKGRRSKMLW